MLEADISKFCVINFKIPLRSIPQISNMVLKFHLERKGFISAVSLAYLDSRMSLRKFPANCKTEYNLQLDIKY